MLIAVEEAEQSLREGNCGFGAVVAKGGEVIAAARDSEVTAGDPTAHAELAAIRLAAARLGPDLDGCRIVSTHEPCPMCATAILWANMGEVVYGFSIAEAIREGRRRIDLPCREIFTRAGKDVTVHAGILRERCAILYDRAVREQIGLLRNADETSLRDAASALARKRIAWLDVRPPSRPKEGTVLLEAAYELLLRKLEIDPGEAPVVERGPKHLVFRSQNFCPTLEACRILGLDTRFVCRRLTESPTAEFLRRIDPHLRFSRSYDTLRPHGPWCEERISLDD